MPTATKTRRRSPRGNWLVVTYHNGEIHWATWIRTWAGVQASRRKSEKYIKEYAEIYNGFKGRVFILDIERMMDFAVTEAANDINELHRLWEIS